MNMNYGQADLISFWHSFIFQGLQAQTHPKATPPVGKIHPFSKIASTFEPLMGF